VSAKGNGEFLLVFIGSKKVCFIVYL